MTVCIAALSDGGKKAVLVADKMLTTQGVFPYQSDGNAEKILKINEHVHVMWCGGLNDSAHILNKAKTKIANNSLTVQDITEQIRLAYLDYLHEVLVNENLISRGIPNIASFYGDASINLSGESRKAIELALATFNLNTNTSFVVCGKDSDGFYKIYTIGINPRFITQLATDGWNTIGSGEGHARFAVIHSPYNLNLSQEKVRKILLSAKKKAEKEPNVGKKEDVVLLN